jgi:hypothetical protein
MAKGEQERGALQALQLNVLVDAQPVERGELPVEVELREGSDAAEPFHAQVIVQVLVDELEHLSEPGEVCVRVRCRQRSVLLDARQGTDPPS